MKRLLYVGSGFVIGVVVARNSAAMPAPAGSAVVLGLVLGLVLAWFAGRRDKAAAVAVAVASARAEAAAAAEAQAAAIASAAVHLHMAGYSVTEPGQEASVERGAPTRVLSRRSDVQLAKEWVHEYDDEHHAEQTGYLELDDEHEGINV